ncbi:glycosyl hydrolase 115 family protein [Bacteroides timonensis]|uniref:glycosyl hydrolase 115 family protein n=1 Tax=Bacteroides timonensis TaxID=1470345 RepID=UPI0005C6E0B0|nr:glycosyl hydrolase 115 family protein [Bacteroides timonensis]
MSIFKSVLLGGMLLLSSSVALAQVSLSQNSSGSNVFSLVGKKDKACVYYDAQDFEVVKTTAGLFANDVKEVSGQILGVATTKEAPQKNCIIVGTLGHNEWIDQMIAKKKLDVETLKNRWESYLVQLVRNPLPGVDKALVIVGSDRRGAAYGLLSVSRTIGVSPWYWWADAPIVKKDQLHLKVDKYISKEPTVKYRGIFINDEDWGLYRWSKRNFEKEVGNFGPRTYAKVCELLLRLQANYLCPAMHDASMAFHRIPENRVVADRFAIIMGSSHCEPLLFNTASEWKRDKMGEWDYINNKKGVDSVLNARVKECAPFENVYTLALRGLHDRAMNASNDMGDRKDMLQEALMAQRQMLIDAIGKPGEEIPQAFTPYKEVLDVYDEGLELPDDVTIIWPDDNYGYMKRLSSPKEQKRSGRSGVYYHSSYLGKPHDHLWMNTVSPTLMYEELRKAYDATADRIWLLNAGDIKSCEFAVDYFLTMAFDIDAFNFERAANYRTEWLCGMLGDQYRNEYQDVVNSFYKLAFARKPEFMGWGYQWTTDKHGRERNTDTDFSLTNYREVDNRLNEYRRIGSTVEKILNNMSDEKQKACFYQSLYYPVKGCELLNRMILDGQRNRWYSIQQRASTKELEKSAKACYDSLEIITNGYNSLLGGKWNHVMTMKQGFAAAYFELPKLRDVELAPTASLGVMAEGEAVLKGLQSFHSLPCFNTYLRQSYYVDVFNKGATPLKWKAAVTNDWILVSKKSGETATEDRIEVSIDWAKVPAGERILGTLDITSDRGEKESVYISVFNPTSPSLAEMDTLFVENNGYVSIDAASFHRKVENDAIKMIIIPNLGCENTAVQLGNPIAPAQRTAGRNTPRLEYDFYTFEQGSVDVYTYVLPTFPISKDRGYAGHEATNVETKYGVCIDEGPVMTPSTSSFEYAQIWYESVLKNCRINKTTLHIDKPGKHTVKIICGDAGTVLQKVVLDFGGMKRSYMGPQPTRNEQEVAK